MRRFIVSIAAFAVGALCCGCGSGGTSSLHCLAGDPFCGSVISGNQLTVDPAWQPQAPVPIGMSATIHITEQLCVGTGSQSGPPPGVQLGCRTPFVPATLTTSVLPIGGNVAGTPCPVTAVVTSPGAVTVTRNGPGDPTLFNSARKSGFCFVQVTDPTTSDGNGGHPAATFLV